MEEESQSERGGVERKMTLAQLLQIKYLLAGILALAVFGRVEDWETNTLTVFVTFALIHSLETSWLSLSRSVTRLASLRSRRRAAKAESEARLRRLLKDLEQAEEQVRSE